MARVSAGASASRNDLEHEVDLPLHVGQHALHEFLFVQLGRRGRSAATDGRGRRFERARLRGCRGRRRTTGAGASGRLTTLGEAGTRRGGVGRSVAASTSCFSMG